MTESRVKKMLDKEFNLVLQRVGDTRPKTSTYFAFADTVTARSYSQRGECHGWMGIKLQVTPGAEPCEIVIHIRMLDESHAQQQEAVGILGVNLIYGAFYFHSRLDRIDCLNILGYPVIVSNYLRYFRLSDYLGRYTKGKMAFVMGIPNLEALFNDAYYDGLKGGIIGAFGALFDRDTLIFVYPMRRDNTPNDIITTENFPVPEHLKYFYAHLRANNKILPVEKYNDANMHIWPEEVLEQIKKGPGQWQASVPEAVAQEIIARCMFGFCSKV